MKKYLLISILHIFFALAILPQICFAQPGALDPTFNAASGVFTQGVATGPEQERRLGIQKSITQADGKIIIAGKIHNYNAVAVEASLLRINPDGTIDHSFNASGMIQGQGEEILDMAIQADGKIIIVGSFTNYNGMLRNSIVRVNTDGSIDNSFNPGTGFTISINPGAICIVSSVFIQNDGKIVVVGYFSEYNNVTRNSIVRINTDGSMDGSYNPGASLSYVFYSLYKPAAMQSDGKVILTSNEGDVNHPDYRKILRLNTDGSIDNSFVAPFPASMYHVFTQVFLQPDGKILVQGSFGDVNTPTAFRVCRLNADGSFDNSFNVGNLTGYATQIFDFDIQDDGKIILTGTFSTYGYGANVTQVPSCTVRLLPNGDVDAGFSAEHGFALSSAALIANCEIQRNHKLVFFATGYTNIITHENLSYAKRLNTDGSLDVETGTGAGDIAADVKTMDIQADGKIVVGGSFQTYNGVNRNSIARINSDGSLDESFNPASSWGSSFNRTKSCLVQPDGKILIWGATNGRANADGTKDMSFNIGSFSFNGNSGSSPETAVLQPDGKIIIAGQFDTYNGNAVKSIARFNNDGSLDPSFNSGSGTGTELPGIVAPIYSLAIQADGKILIGGDFATYNGIARPKVARLNTDGSLDESFVPPAELFGGATAGILAIKVQPDGKVLIAGPGYFIYNNVQRVGIARLNTDGSIDESFVPSPTAINSQITPQTISLQSDGKIILGGSFNFFTSPPGQPQRYNLIRLNSDGSVDESFNQGGTGFHLMSYPSAVFASLIQPDGKLLIAGGFNSAHGQDPADYNGSPVYNVARILTACIAPTVPTISATSTNITYPQNTTLSIATGDLNNATNWKWYSNSCGGTLVGTGNSITVSPNRTITYYVRGEGGCVTPGACASITITVQAGRYYIRDVEPFGVTDNLAAMNTVFGTGNWADADYTTNPASIFTSTTSFVMMDGIANAGITQLNTYLSINNSLIENWVLNGGRLFINNTFPDNSNLTNCGFNSTVINFGTPISGSLTAVAANINDTIFKGPYTPITTSFTGNIASHAIVTGNGLTRLVKSDGVTVGGADNGTSSLSYKQWGNGFAFFGALTAPTLTWTPQPQAINFWYNVFDYVNSVTAATNYILVGNLPATSFCAGSNLSLPYTAAGFTAGNIFTVQLSDANGSFASPVNIGTISSLTSGTINTTIPANTVAGTGYRIRVSASLPNTISENNGADLTINIPVTPSVSIALTNGNIPFCSGQPLTFTATPVNGGSNPIYQWKLNGDTDIGTNSPVLTYNNFADGDVLTCRVTSNATCSTQPSAISNGITLTVSEPFTPDIVVRIVDQTGSYYATTLNICAAATVSFVTASNYIGSNPHYQWKLNGNNVGNDLPGYTQTGFNDNDVIVCELTSDVPCSGTTTVPSQAINVSTYSVSAAAVSINASDTYCAGTTAEFDAYVQNAGPVPSYKWKKNGINVGSDLSYYLDDALVTGDVITLSITTDPVCETPITIQSGNSITVTINQPVTPAITITAANPSSSLQNYFTAAITNGGNNPYYEWKKNDIIVGSNQNNYLDLALVTGDVITCTLYSNADCAVTSIVTSNSIIVSSITYCIPNTIYGYNPCELAWISNVVLGTAINKMSGCDGFYTDYTTTDTLKTTAGQTIDFAITDETDGTNWGMYSNIYIDYNRDGDFDDAGEKLTNDIYTYIGGPAAGTFTLPVLIAPGSYRIRVMLNSATLNACELGFGEAEDYILQITQPDYCIPVISNPCDMWISNVTIGTINNSSTAPTNCSAGGYTDYSILLSTTAAPGRTVSFSIGAGNNDQYADIYIDYNSDGDFDDEGEWVAQNIIMSPFGVNAIGAFMVPVTQAYGFYRIRVRSHAYDNIPLTGPGACDNYASGETEDYMLVVTCIPNGSDIIIQGNNIDIADGDDSPGINDYTDFGNVELGGSFIRTFTIKNTGINVLNLGTVTLAGGVNNNFFSIISQPLVSVLNAGESTTFSIQFDSPLWGYGFNFNTTVHVANDNCDKKEYDFAIQATAACPAAGPDINVQGNGIDIARFDFTPDPADNTDFGTVTANNSLSKTFVIQNMGITDLHIIGIQLSDYDNLLQFAVTTQPASTVAPGSSTSFTLTFAPVGSGSRYTYVRINSNDCDESYYDYQVSGNAECPILTPEINVKGNSIDIADGDNTPDDADNTNFGVAALNTSVSKTFVVENTGIDPLNISGVTFTGANAADFSVTTNPATTVAPGSTTTFTVQFLPTTVGPKTAIMHIHNSDCDEGDYDIAIKGSDGTVCMPVVEQPCNMYISNVAMGTINNNSSCSAGSGYSDYSGLLSTIAAPGETVQFSASAYGNEQKVNVYIDYNKDGDFEDAGELLLSDLYMSPDFGNGIVNATGSFIVPQTLAPGNYRIRVISEYVYNSLPTPCYTYYGEAEDYTLVVQAGTSITVNLKLFLQGYYTGDHAMQPVLNNQAVPLSLPMETDTITIELHDPQTFALVDAKQAVLLTDGAVSTNFSQPSGAYFIAIKHRNSIQTWSAEPIDCPTQIPYDFTVAASKAFGDNQVEVEPGVWAFYVGDLNQDEFVDGFDYSGFNDENLAGVNGVYTANDMNGDGFVDGFDYSQFNDNNLAGIMSIHP